jgi:hypothetical protein
MVSPFVKHIAVAVLAGGMALGGVADASAAPRHGGGGGHGGGGFHGGGGGFHGGGGGFHRGGGYARGYGHRYYGGGGYYGGPYYGGPYYGGPCVPVLGILSGNYCGY